MPVRFNMAGGGLDPDEMTAVPEDVLAGKKFGGAGSDEPQTGTLALSGNAGAGDVLAGKTYYSTNPQSKQTGTLALSGNAGAGDVVTGKTFYNTDAKVKVNGSLSLSGNAAANQVLAGRTFYTTNPKTKVTGTMVNRGNVASTINPGSTYTIPEGYHSGGGKITAKKVADMMVGTKENFVVETGNTITANSFVSYLKGLSTTTPGYTQSGLKKVNVAEMVPITSTNPSRFLFNTCKLTDNLFIVTYSTRYKNTNGYWIYRIGARALKISITNITFGSELLCYPVNDPIRLDSFVMEKVSDTGAAFLCQAFDSGGSAGRWNVTVQFLKVNPSTLQLTQTYNTIHSGYNSKGTMGYDKSGRYSAIAALENNSAFIYFYADGAFGSSNQGPKAIIARSDQTTGELFSLSDLTAANIAASSCVEFTPNRVLMIVTNASACSNAIFDISGTSIITSLSAKFTPKTVFTETRLIKVINNRVLWLYKTATAICAEVLTISGNKITYGTQYTIATGTFLNWDASRLAGDYIAVTYDQNGTIYNRVVYVNGTTVTSGNAVKLFTADMDFFRTIPVSNGIIALTGFNDTTLSTNVIYTPTVSKVIKYDAARDTVGVAMAGGAAGTTIQVVHP